MSILGTPEDYDGDLAFVVVDREHEPHRYLKTLTIFMSLPQAQELSDALQEHIKNSPFSAFALHTGRRKKGNPVIGEDIFEQDF